jgi:creatinine amidohydrolase
MKWAELTAPEVARAAAAGAVAVWPIGATEQHGGHLVTGFDLRAAEAVVDRAVAAAGVEVVVLPGLAIGASDHWLPLGATLSVQPTTLVAVIADVLRSIAAAGFAHAVLVNGHAGNVGPAITAVAGHTGTAASVVSYWTLVDGAELAARSAADDGGIGHAGELETSVARHLGGGLERGPVPADPGRSLATGPGSRGDVFLRSPRPLAEAPSGVYGDPRAATSELGEVVIEGAARALGAHLRALAQGEAR